MRGYRNNNPCNIRISNEKWQGEKQPSTDKEFKQFESMDWGFRAVFKLLNNYKVKYKCDTLTKMIHRFAPTNENHTENYIKFIVDKTHVDPTSILDTKNKIMINIVAAMAHCENGQPANINDVNKGWELYLYGK